MPNRDPTVFDSDFRYASRLVNRRSRARISRHSHWFAAGIMALGIAIWLGHGPIASIGTSASLQEHRTKLTSQLSAVLAEEDRIIRESITLGDLLPTSVVIKDFTALETRLDATSTGIGITNAANTASTGIVRWQSIPTTLRSKKTVSELLQLEIANLNSAVQRNNVRFDLEYLLIPESSPEVTSTATAIQIPEALVERWITVDILKGDSLTRIFKRLRLDPTLAIAMSKRPGAKILNMLRTGPHLQILLRERQFISLRYHPDRLSILSVNRDGRGYRVETIQRKFDITQKEVKGTIQSSLYKSGINNQLSQALLYDLTSIFQWKIDFNSEIQPGDQYALVYEERSLDGKKIGTGPILAAKFIVGGRPYHAIRHVNQRGVTRYFTPGGESLHGLFLRSPMRIPRITSSYSPRRYHPVLKIWRAHKGVDYGGRTGDPIMATADGQVRFAGRKNHYGKVIILQHGQKYSTLYAHLSRFASNIRSGRNVSQGEVIGYVGRTGLATGPHLHYEFRVDNVHRNPLTVKLPRSFAIDRSERTDFMRQAQFWSARLDRLAKR